SHAAELVGMAPDVVLASSTPVTVALKDQHADLPIVFVQVTDPVGEGLVANLAHPGGHLTGFTSFEFSIGTKWLETLKQVAPRVRPVQARPKYELAVNLKTAAALGLDVPPTLLALADEVIE